MTVSRVSREAVPLRGEAASAATGGEGSRRSAVRAGRSSRGRALAAVLGLLSRALQLLPDGPLHRLAHAAGLLLYVVQPARRSLVRSNLRRVCAYLAETHLVAPDSAAAKAARSDRWLERLVRAAFGHYARSYLEAAIVGGYARPDRLARIEADDPTQLAEALGSGPRPSGPLIVVGLHFGAIELPALSATQRGLPLTAPMESLADPHLQAYLQRSRGASGVRLIPVAGAGRRLADCLAKGEAVALVADRLVGGRGARVDLFGAPVRLPVGPAALAVQTRAPAWLVAVRRSGWGHYRAHLERLGPPEGGSRRDQLISFLDAQARAYERAIALAPEQWWTLFFPIWEER